MLFGEASVGTPTPIMAISIFPEIRSGGDITRGLQYYEMGCSKALAIEDNFSWSLPVTRIARDDEGTKDVRALTNAGSGHALARVEHMADLAKTTTSMPQ